MSLDLEPAAFPVQAKKDEISHVLRSRKRKLCQLYALATPEAAPIPDLRDAHLDPPSDPALIAFLDLNSLEKGRYFNESSLPTRPHYASIVVRTRRGKHSPQLQQKQAPAFSATPAYAASSGVEQSPQLSKQSSPRKPRSPSPGQTSAASAAATAHGPPSQHPSTPSAPAVELGVRDGTASTSLHSVPRFSPQPRLPAASAANVDNSVAQPRARRSPTRPASIKVSHEKPGNPLPLADTDSAVANADTAHQTNARSVTRTSRPDSPPYSPGTDPNAAGAPISEDPTYKDSNASSTILTPHRDEEHSNGSTSRPASGRSSPEHSGQAVTLKPNLPSTTTPALTDSAAPAAPNNAEDIADIPPTTVTTTSTNKSELTRNQTAISSDIAAKVERPEQPLSQLQSRPGTSIDSSSTVHSATSHISHTSSKTAVSDAKGLGSSLVEATKSSRPPMASFGVESIDQARSADLQDLALVKRGSAKSSSKGADHLDSISDAMDVDQVPAHTGSSIDISSSSALRPRKDAHTRVAKSRRNRSSTINSVTLNQNRSAEYSDIVQCLRQNRAPNGKSIVKERDYMQLLIMRQTFNSVYNRDLSNILGNSNKTLMSHDWWARYREEEENRILQRIYHLQDTNRWSLRLPKASPEAAAPVSHWDMLLKDMKWLRTDFKEERKMKMAVAANLAHGCAEWVAASPEERRSLQVNSANDAPDQLDDGLRLETAGEESIFTVPLTQVYLNRASLSAVDEKILSQLQLYVPEGVEKQDYFPEAAASDLKPRAGALTPRGASSTAASQRNALVAPGTALSHENVAEFMREVEEASEDEDGNPRPHKSTKEVPPEDQVCALFDPANKQMRTRLNTVWPFRPPNTPLPPQSYYEHRHSSQWTPEDDKLLREYVKSSPSNWSLIADRMSSKSLFASYADRRTPWECFERLLVLEQPSPSQQQYLRHFHYRLERARAAFQEQQDTIQRQAQQAAATQANGQPAPTAVQKRFPTPMPVERKNSKRFLALLDAARKLARKKETQLTKLQNSQSHSEAQAAQNRASLSSNNNNRVSHKPQQISKMRHERDLKEQERLQILRERQRLAAFDAQKKAQQQLVAAGLAVPNNHQIPGQAHSQSQVQQQAQQMAAAAAHAAAAGPQARMANGHHLPANMVNPHMAVPLANHQGRMPANTTPATAAAAANAMQIAMQNGQIQVNGQPLSGSRMAQVANMLGAAASHHRSPSTGASSATSVSTAQQNPALTQENMQRMVQHANQLRILQQLQQQTQQGQHSQQPASNQRTSPHMQFNPGAVGPHGSPNMGSSSNMNSTAAQIAQAFNQDFPPGMQSPGLPQVPTAMASSSSPPQMHSSSPSNAQANSNNANSASTMQHQRQASSSSTSNNQLGTAVQQQQQQQQGQNTNNRPQVLSSGHVPQLMSLQQQIKRQNPELSNEQAQEIATQQLRNAMMQQSRQNAINAAAGAYGVGSGSGGGAGTVGNGATAALLQQQQQQALIAAMQLQAQAQVQAAQAQQQQQQHQRQPSSSQPPSSSHSNKANGTNSPAMTSAMPALNTNINGTGGSNKGSPMLPGSGTGTPTPVQAQNQLQTGTPVTTTATVSAANSPASGSMPLSAQQTASASANNPSAAAAALQQRMYQQQLRAQMVQQSQANGASSMSVSSRLAAMGQLPPNMNINYQQALAAMSAANNNNNTAMGMNLNNMQMNMPVNYPAANSGSPVLAGASMMRPPSRSTPGGSVVAHSPQLANANPNSAVVGAGGAGGMAPQAQMMMRPMSAQSTHSTSNSVHSAQSPSAIAAVPSLNTAASTSGFAGKIQSPHVSQASPVNSAVQGSDGAGASPTAAPAGTGTQSQT